MVKILANGDIVPDNDPRAQGSTQRRPEKREAPKSQAGSDRVGDGNRSKSMRNPIEFHAKSYGTPPRIGSTLAPKEASPARLGPFGHQPCAWSIPGGSAMLCGYGA